METTPRPLQVTFARPQVILFSADVQRASAFYQRLGFAQALRVPPQGSPIHVDLMLDGYRLGLASISSARRDRGLDPVTAGQRATVTLWTQDTAAAHRALTGAGAPALAEPQLWLDHLLIAWIADPDGHPIQLVQELADS